MDHPQLPVESDQKQKDFYNKLRDKVSKWVEKNLDKKSEYTNYILLVPDFFYLLVKLTLDERVSAIDKAKFAGVIAYFFSLYDRFKSKKTIKNLNAATASQLEELAALKGELEALRGASSGGSAASEAQSTERTD